MDTLTPSLISRTFTQWLLAASILWICCAGAEPSDTPTSELREIIEVYERAGDYEEMVRTALNLRDNAETTEDRFDAMRTIGRAYALAGDREKSLDTLEAAARLVDASVSPEALAQLYIDIAGILLEIGQYERAIEVVERGIKSIGDGLTPALRGELEVMHGGALVFLDRLDEAIAIYKTASEFPLDDQSRLLMRNNVGMVYKDRGELDQALTVFAEILEDSLRTEQQRYIVYALLELGDINRQLGNHNTARSNLEDALARSVASEQRPWQLWSHAYLADLEKAVGNEAAVEQHQASVAKLQVTMQTQKVEDRAKVLQMIMEVMERDNQITLLQVEQELQAVRLDRSRKLFWLAGVATLFLLIALWLALKQVRLRALANRKLDQLANTDTLTGLYNRRYLLNLAQATLGQPKSAVATASLILVDLDRFKLVNDQHGHDHGDAVLAETARRLGTVLRNGETLARWGGEEFLAFLPGCGLDEAAKIAERMREAIMVDPIVYQGVSHKVTATFGVAEIETDRKLDPAFRRADTALYEGKNTGRNRIIMAEPEKVPEVTST